MGFEGLNTDFNVYPNEHLLVSYESIVGMAVYKNDKLEWVKQAVDSVLTQTYQNFLCILVIDGDVPDSLYEYILAVFNQNPARILLVTSLNNVGLSACMNFAVNYALNHFRTSEYFFRMDSDDVSVVDRFEKQIAYFKHNPDLSIVGSSLVEINENGKIVGKRVLPKSHDEIKRIFPRRCAINHPTVCIKMKVFLDGFRYKVELKNTQDYFLWTDLCSEGYKFSNLPEVLLKFRRVNDFYKRRGLSKSLNEFKARFYAMKKLRRFTFYNVFYAIAVICLRLMPSKIVKLAYKLDRYILNK